MGGIRDKLQVLKSDVAGRNMQAVDYALELLG